MKTRTRRTLFAKIRFYWSFVALIFVVTPRAFAYGVTHPNMSEAEIKQTANIMAKNHAKRYL